MKFAHISDLHLGKKVHQFSMIEEQKHILDNIVEIVRKEKAEAIMIAGDVYDKIYPSAEAISLFDFFLVELAKYEIKVFVISGNHDSAERIAFLGQLTQKAGVYLSPVYHGQVTKVGLSDEFGPINVYLLPFIKPVNVRHFYPEEEITNYTDAMQVVVQQMELNLEERNLLVAHQFVTGALRTDSEEISVGGLDNVDARVFADFDYVALGHIHRPQSMGDGKIRYSGTPLKYSFSEAEDQKSITMVEIGKKEEVSIKTIPLQPIHDMKKIKGEFLEVINPANFPMVEAEDYLSITLTDEQDIPEVFGRLSAVYPNLMQIEYDNTRTRQKRTLQARTEIAKTSPMDLFEQLYETMNNQPMSERQQAYIQGKIEAIWKGEVE